MLGTLLEGLGSLSIRQSLWSSLEIFILCLSHQLSYLQTFVVLRKKNQESNLLLNLKPLNNTKCK